MPLTPGVRLGHFAWVTAMVLATAAGGLVAKSQQVSPPPLRGGVDLVTIDVQITPALEAPLRDFQLSDFDVRIAGQKRPAVSATLLHYDAGAITRDPPRAATPDCVFGFQRKSDRTTVHYLIGVDTTDADRKEVKQVDVKLVDAAYAVQRYVWRSPIRRD